MTTYYTFTCYPCEKRPHLVLSSATNKKIMLCVDDSADKVLRVIADCQHLHGVSPGLIIQRYQDAMHLYTSCSRCISNIVNGYILHKQLFMTGVGGCCINFMLPTGAWEIDHADDLCADILRLADEYHLIKFAAQTATGVDDISRMICDLHVQIALQESCKSIIGAIELKRQKHCTFGWSLPTKKCLV